MITVVIVCRPFSVSPQTASVDVGKFTQIDVSYSPVATGASHTYITVYYDTGKHILFLSFPGPDCGLAQDTL